MMWQQTVRKDENDDDDNDTARLHKRKWPKSLMPETPQPPPDGKFT